MTLLERAAHIVGILVTGSLIPLAALLMVFNNFAWGLVCLGLAAAALFWAAWWSRDRSPATPEPEWLPWDEDGQLPAPPHAMSGRPAGIQRLDGLPFGMCATPGKPAPAPAWFPQAGGER